MHEEELATQWLLLKTLKGRSRDIYVGKKAKAKTTGEHQRRRSQRELNWKGQEKGKQVKRPRNNAGWRWRLFMNGNKEQFQTADMRKPKGGFWASLSQLSRSSGMMIVSVISKLWLCSLMFGRGNTFTCFNIPNDQKGYILKSLPLTSATSQLLSLETWSYQFLSYIQSRVVFLAYFPPKTIPKMSTYINIQFSQAVFYP